MTLSVEALTRRRLLAFVAISMAAPTVARASNASVQISIDTSNAPQLAAWADALRPMMQRWWPVITATLSSPGFEAPDRVNVVFQEFSQANVGAATVGDTIHVNLADIQAHPDDFGRVAHEMVHVVQAYPQPNITWLVEGIADYMRYYVLLPNDPRRAFNAHRFTYQLGYQPAAALLDWVERTHGAGSVRRVNAAMRSGGDGEAELLKITGATPFTLWRGYLKSLPASG
jgi:hypothetical protein